MPYWFLSPLGATFTVDIIVPRNKQRNNPIRVARWSLLDAIRVREAHASLRAIKTSEFVDDDVLVHIG